VVNGILIYLRQLRLALPSPRHVAAQPQPWRLNFGNYPASTINPYWRIEWKGAGPAKISRTTTHPSDHRRVSSRSLDTRQSSVRPL